MRILPILVSIIALAASASAQADDMMRVIVFGDSLTSGHQLRSEQAFAAKLERKLKDIGFQNLEVINMSVTGETSTGGLERLNSVLVKKPDVVVVELGANDIKSGVNPNLVYSNLANILGTLLHKQIYVVLVGMKPPAHMEYEYAQQVEAIYSKLVGFYRVPFYPFALEGVYGKPELNLADGYHPNAQGVDVMVENIYRLVDAGLRWRWNIRQQEMEQEQQLRQQPEPPTL